MQPYNCRIHFCQEFLCMAWEQHEQPATHSINMCCWKGLIKRFASSNMYLLRTWIIDTLASQTQGQKPSPSHGLYDLYGWDSNQPQMVLVALVSHIWYKLEHRFPKISHCFNIVLGYNVIPFGDCPLVYDVLLNPPGTAPSSQLRRLQRLQRRFSLGSRRLVSPTPPAPLALAVVDPVVCTKWITKSTHWCLVNGGMIYHIYY